MEDVTAERPWKTVKDGKGSTYTGIIDIDGEHYPGDPGCYERIMKADTFKAREDDIWIVGYPKCGAHWTYDIIRMVLAGSAQHRPEVKDDNFYEVCSFSAMEALPSPRVLDTHLPVHRMPRDVINKKCKLVFNIRNPKDVAVSYYNHVKSLHIYGYDGTFNGYFKMFLDGQGEYNSWFDMTLGWYEYSKTHPEVLVLKYEDMIKDLTSAVRAVAKHLEKPLSEKVCRQIAHECDFDVMKRRKKAAEKAEWFKNPNASMYRKGKVGDWKNWFTVAQNEEFDRVFKEQMKDTDLEIDFDLDSSDSLNNNETLNNNEIK